jgi:hypothetical protein
MIRPDAMNTLYQTNLQAIKQCTAGLLDAGESVWKLQMDAADELCQTAFAQLRASGSDIHTGNPMAGAPAAFSQSLERGTQLLRGYVDTAVKLQSTLAQIAESQMPVMTRTLGDIWLAPWAGIAPGAAESLRGSVEHAESRTKKAA